jgi:hypothetical protein
MRHKVNQGKSQNDRQNESQCEGFCDGNIQGQFGWICTISAQAKRRRP